LQSNNALLQNNNALLQDNDALLLQNKRAVRCSAKTAFRGEVRIGNDRLRTLIPLAPGSG